MTDDQLDIQSVYTGLQYLESFEDIAVAVSGGADSMALLLLLLEWSQHIASLGDDPPEIHVLTVDHALRPEASEEAAWVREQSLKIGCKTTVLEWSGEKPETRIQERARTARYNLMTSWCKTHNVPALLTAHHLDDQAETVIMRLARGAGVKGLAGIARNSEWAGINIIRPLLDISKQTLQNYLTEKKQEWIEDPSNIRDDFERVRIRKAIPQLSQFNIGPLQLARTAKRMRRAEYALDSLTNEALQKYENCMPEGITTINWELFNSAPEEICLRVLSKVTQKIGGRERPAEMAGLEEAMIEMRQTRNAVISISGCIVQREKTRLIISREVRGNNQSLQNLQPGQSTVWDQRFNITLTREAPDGITVHFLTEEGYLQLLQKGLSADSIPGLLRNKHVRASLPAFSLNSQIISVPFLAYSDFSMPENAIKIVFLDNF